MKTEEKVLRLNLESFKDPTLNKAQVHALVESIEILLGNLDLEVLKKVGHDLHKAKQSLEFRVKAAETISKLIGETK
jgi:hypothetical protein